MIFIDYQNLFGWARRCFHKPPVPPEAGHIDPLRLGQLLLARRHSPSSLAGVRVYRGRPSPNRQAKSAAANDRQTDVWRRDPQVTVIRRPLRYPKGWPSTPAVEKGIDVAIAVDLVRLAMTRAFDAAILLSADTDLQPALEIILRTRLSHVEVASWSGAGRLCLPGSRLPWCHHLDKDTYLQVQDLTDYTRIDPTEEQTLPSSAGGLPRAQSDRDPQEHSEQCNNFKH
jgi:hypothetical protein